MLLQDLDKDEQALYETYRRQGQNDTEARISAVTENIRRKHQNPREDTAREALKDSFKEMFLREGKSAEEAERRAEIAAAGRTGIGSV